VITPERILVFRKSSLGDVILTLPVLQALKKEFPGAGIDYLTRTLYAPVIKHNPAVHRVIAFNDNRSFIDAVFQVRKNKYDLFVDLQSNFQSLIIRSALFSARRVKYSKRRLARELMVRRPQLKLKVGHTLDAYFVALRRLGLNATPLPPVLALPSESLDFANDLIDRAFPERQARLIALCPGARHYEKRWPHFKELARRLLENPEIGLLVISSAQDSLPADLGLNHRRLLPVRDFEILHVAALLAGCRATVTNDSGLMHLACAVGTPVLAIFGPTNPRLGFAPVLPGSKVICDDVFCSPCSVHGQKACSQLEKYCFTNITAERVIDTLSDMF